MSVEEPSLASLRAGDQDAWAQLHRLHYPRVWNSVNRMLNNPSLTDDVVQEAFLKAYRTIGRFKGNSKIGTWLYRIAINQGLDVVRKKKRREKWVSFLNPLNDREDEPSVPDQPVESEVSLNLENADLRKMIVEAMDELSEDHRTVVQLRLVDEMSLADTAKALGIKQGTVNSRLHYACEHLRRKLKTKLKDS
ncbi:MAG: RNA polymerase sigma factor [Verrucomicrobiota bacterium]